MLGSATWSSFRTGSHLARVALEQGFVEPFKMQSVFAALRLLHAGIWFAYAAQGLTALAACAVLARIAARRPDVQAELVLLVPATLLCTPFVLDYDLTCLAVPVAWVARAASRTGWLAWEKIVLLAAYALPLVARPMAMATSLSPAPFVIAALLLVAARRIRGGAGTA